MNKNKITINTSRFAIDPKSKNYLNILNKINSYKKLEHKKKQELATYVILMYDKNSSVRKDLSIPYVQKKKLCLEMCSLISKRIPEDIVRLLSGYDENFCNLTSYYLSLQHAIELFSLAAYEFSINKAFLKITTSENIDTASLKFIDSITEKHTELERRIFGGDEFLGFRESLNKETEQYKNDFRLEEVVETLEVEGKLPDSWNPHPDNYKPNDLKFHGDGEE